MERIIYGRACVEAWSHERAYLAWRFARSLAWPQQRIWWRNGVQRGSISKVFMGQFKDLGLYPIAKLSVIKLWSACNFRKIILATSDQINRIGTRK